MEQQIKDLLVLSVATKSSFEPGSKPYRDSRLMNDHEFSTGLHDSYCQVTKETWFPLCQATPPGQLRCPCERSNLILNTTKAFAFEHSNLTLNAPPGQHILIMKRLGWFC